MYGVNYFKGQGALHQYQVLIVDDDPIVVRYLQAIFKETGYKTETAADGLAAIEAVQKEMPDIILLDMLMPKFDGLQVCGLLREWTQTPIIIVSTAQSVEDKVKCLEAGADDYVCKPFAAAELIARVESVLRRSGGAINSVPSVLKFDDIAIDFSSKKVTAAGGEIKLTPTEFGILSELALNAGKVLDHSSLLKTVWGSEYSSEKEYLRVFINRLRRKLEPDPANPRYIITVSNVGYMFSKAA